MCVYASRQFFRNKDHFFNFIFYWHLEGLSPFFVPKKKGFPKFEPPQHLHPPNKTLHKNGKQLGLSVICLFDVWKKSDIFSQIVVCWWCTMVQSAKIHLEINPSKKKIFKIVHCSQWFGKLPTSLFITWNKSGKSFKFTIHLHCLIPPNDACSIYAMLGKGLDKKLLPICHFPADSNTLRNAHLQGKSQKKVRSRIFLLPHVAS